MQNYNSKFQTAFGDRCFQFSFKIIPLADQLPHTRSIRVITDQLIHWATSIGATLIEARILCLRLEFKKCYEITLKSANETEYWLTFLQKNHLSSPNTSNCYCRKLLK